MGRELHSRTKLWLVPLLFGIVAPALLADPPDKLITMPQIEQFGLGPGGTALPNDGLEYCGPTSMTMNFGWLGLAGHSRLAPTSSAAQTNAFFANLDQTLGGLMGATGYGGTDISYNGSGYLQGIQTYMAMKGYYGQFTLTTNGLYGPDGTGGPGGAGTTPPTWADMQASFTNPPSGLAVGTVLLGWYDNSHPHNWTREGGHWITLVGAPANNQIQVNNPYPFPGFAIQQLVTLETIGNQPANDGAGDNYNLQDYANAVNGIDGIGSSTPLPGYDIPVIEQWFSLVVAETAPAVSTWQLNQGVNALNIGIATQEVLAPIADSGSGASSLALSGGGTLIFTQTASYSGGTTVTDSTLASTVASGNPFGSGEIVLQATTLSLAPSGSGQNVSLSSPANLKFYGGSQLNLDLGDNQSLTYTVDGFNRFGTLVIAASADSGPAELGSNVKLFSTTEPNVQSGMVSPGFLGQDSSAGANQSGYFLTYDSTDGFKAAATVTGDINAVSNVIYAANSAQVVNPGTTVTVTALQVNGTTISGGAGTVLEIGNSGASFSDAGVILNGGTIATEALSFGSNNGFIYTSGAGGTISAEIQGTSSSGVVFYGPGTVSLAASPTYTGPTIVQTGTLSIGSGVVLTGVVTVEAAATLNQNGGGVGTGTQPVALAINGTRTGSGNIAGAVTVSDSGVFEGQGTIAGNTVVYGTLTNVTNPAAPNDTLTFQNLTLKTDGTYLWKMRSITDMSLNDYFEVSGQFMIESAAQLAFDFTEILGSDPSSGNSFWDQEQTFVLAQTIGTGSLSFGSEGIFMNSLPYASGSFIWDIDVAGGTLGIQWVPVPEPSVVSLFALAGAAIWGGRRRRGRAW